MTPETVLERAVTPAEHLLHGDLAHDPAAPTEWQIVHIPVGHIVPSPFQPRQIFDEAELHDLALSIKAHGVQQPVLVRPVADENAKGPRYELVAGERRWRASRLARRKTVPAIVRTLSDQDAAELAVIENVQRANLTVIEEARGYQQLALKFRLKEERIAKKVGKSVATVKETLRLLALPESVQALLAKRQLSASHGHELLRLAPHPQVCEAVALRCVRDKLPASSLVGNPLPHAQEMKRAGMIQELGFTTQFDWKRICQDCPHKALVSSGYGTYCLRPDEWKRKQATAIEVRQQEAARVLEEARAQGDATVNTQTLAPGSFRSLLHAQIPPGCSEQCPCRGQACDPKDALKRLPVCLRPERFEELRAKERTAHEEARQRRYSQDFEQALEALQAENVGLARTAALLVWPLLKAHYRFSMQADTWTHFVRGVAARLELLLPWEQIFDRESGTAPGVKLLLGTTPEALLRFGAGLILAEEAQGAIRYGGETPYLDVVLGREATDQPELGTDEEAEDSAYQEEPDDFDSYDEEYPDEHEE